MSTCVYVWFDGHGWGRNCGIQGFRGEVSRKLTGEGWGGQGKITHRSSGDVLVGSSQVREGKSDIFLMVTVEGGVSGYLSLQR